MQYKIKFILVAILFSVASITAKAQTQFTTNEVRQFMSKGEQNGIEIALNGTSAKDATKALSKWAKSMKAKIVKEKNSPEVLIDNAVIPTVSSNTVDLYAVITPIDKGSKLTVYTDLGGAFISSAAYSTQYSAMEAVMKDFAKNQALTAAGDQVKAEQKTLKTLNGDLKKLISKKKDYLKGIDKAKAQIQKYEDNIKKNDADQAAKQQQISLQQQIIETVKTKQSSLKY